jgi:CRISPR-associated protein Cas1
LFITGFQLLRIKEKMDQLSPSDLKSILHSKRANLYYLEHCRVLQKDGRVLYLTEKKKENLYWNIPIANTTAILLGTGTSITQAAVRMLASAGVLIGFCGGGGTPLLVANEIEWLTPQNEYRPTEYMQSWMYSGLMNRRGSRLLNFFKSFAWSISRMYGVMIVI